MTWIAHATRTLTTGQLYWTIIGALTGLAMAADTIRHHTRHHNRQPQPTRPYDWASDPYYRQACNVHRRTA